MKPNLISAMAILAVFLIGIWPEYTGSGLRGGLTWYGGPQFENKHLACPGYRYEKATGPWLAVDWRWYKTGRVRCGDVFVIEFYDGSRMVARALDAGRHADFTIWDTGLPFIADMPTYWRAGRETRTGTLRNMSAILRRRAE